ncbi:pilus assembly protein PilZ [Methylobacterium sp. J-092]|uniref:pilus assembly protein PilZ n=1 Tax=Methylobacterium sp. J-092 TaxID=2836667 RepID=UPI001FB91065|nr:pilus assembly protein PilZ [Methylobacterium sp. J-092]MCJ2009156.1 pilus assembly protein PilZ [Methylobacterium sp. J-092]
MSGLGNNATVVQSTENTDAVDALILSGRVMVEGGPEYLCQARIDDLDAVAIQTPAPGRPRDAAVCYLDKLGALPGRIGITDTQGFTLHPTLSAERRARITVRLAWHTSRAAWTAEQRAALRIVPEYRDVIVSLPEERGLHGLILDVSRTGAKIQLPFSTTTEVGASVTVGKRYASVVRVMDTVIAVKFRLPFSEGTFNTSIRL